MIDHAIQLAAAGQNLSMQEMSDVMDVVMQGQCPEDAMARLLVALHEKGESTNEIAGAAAASRRHMTPIQSQAQNLLDTCGTGGDCSGTFNISTAAALVIAAAGVPVAKHGNRSITSKSGSADVLAALGVNIDADVSTVQRCLDQLGICFCFAPLMHPSMKHVAAVRRRLGTPTIFNLLGPLCNPARAPYQLLGVGRPELRSRLATALALLGTEGAAVVCGSDGLDEVTLTGHTEVTLVVHNQLHDTTWSPADFLLPTSALDSLLVDGPESSAAMIQQILAGQKGPPRDIVVINAAAALWTARQCAQFPEAVDRAGEAIDSGAARNLLVQLARLSHA